MANHRNTVLKQLIGIGAVAGMRATFAPAVVSHYLSNHPSSALANSKLSFIESPVTAVITKVLSVLEIAGDKAPSAPNRTAMPQILGRIASGAFAGAVISMANKENVIKGILIGGTSALAATFASFYIRQYIDKIPHVKDVATGAAEDIIALTSGILVMR